MSERPAPSWEAPEGTEPVAVEDAEWRVVTGKRCRRGFGRGKPTCGRPSAAELKRRTSGPGLGYRWWPYCPEHMYGRWIEDGKIMHWIACEVPASANDSKGEGK